MTGAISRLNIAAPCFLSGCIFLFYLFCSPHTIYKVVVLPWRRRRCESFKKIFRRQSRESTSTHYYTRSERRDVEARRRRGAGEVVPRAAKDCGHGRRTMCGHGPRLTTSQPRQGWSAGAPSGRAVRGGTGWQGATMASRRASQSGGAPGREEAAGPGAAGALGRQGADRRVACAPVARGLSDDGWALDVTKLERQRGARDRDARHAPRPWPSCMALRQWPWLCLPGGRAWIMGPKRHDRPARARSARARHSGGLAPLTRHPDG